VSEIVDIDDPNMLDKIDSPLGKDSSQLLHKVSCVCSSPENRNTCNYCLTNSNQKNKIVPKLFNYDTASHKKTLSYTNNTNNLGTNYFNIHNHFNESTPIHGMQFFNTPGYARHTNFSNNSESKMNYAKYNYFLNFSLDKMFFSSIPVDKDLISPKKDQNDLQ
jgi:hypothetical protein